MKNESKCCGCGCKSSEENSMSSCDNNKETPKQSDMTEEMYNTYLNTKLKDLLNVSMNKEISTDKVDLTDYKKVEYEDGTVINVHKSELNLVNSIESYKDVEIDCDLADKDGNLLPEETDDGPAKSDYKPGMLRHLKSKFYPNDHVGEEAQNRLTDNTVDWKEVGNQDETNGKTLVDNKTVIDKPITYDHSYIEQLKESRAILNQHEKSLEIDKELTVNQTVPIQLDNGVIVHVPNNMEFDKLNGHKNVVENPTQVKEKLESIFKATVKPTVRTKTKLNIFERVLLSASHFFGKYF